MERPPGQTVGGGSAEVLRTGKVGRHRLSPSISHRAQEVQEVLHSQLRRCQLGRRPDRHKDWGSDGKRHRIHINSSFVKSITLRFYNSNSSNSSGSDRTRKCLLDGH